MPYMRHHCFLLVQALDMGLVNAVVPLGRLEEETLIWARQMLRNSPTALRMIKAALNAAVTQSPAALSQTPQKRLGMPAAVGFADCLRGLLCLQWRAD